jgi:hypothetical protein
VNDVNLNIFFQDWPASWSVELTSSDTQFVQVDSVLYVYNDLSGEGVGIVTINVYAPQGTENDTGTVHIAGTIEKTAIGGISIQVVPPINIFICGDVNGDETVNLLDVLYLINYVYKGGPAPNPLESADVNSSGTINIVDIVYLINFLYKGGPVPNCP